MRCLRIIGLKASILIFSMYSCKINPMNCFIHKNEYISDFLRALFAIEAAQNSWNIDLSVPPLTHTHTHSRVIGVHLLMSVYRMLSNAGKQLLTSYDEFMEVITALQVITLPIYSVDEFTCR